MFDFYVGSFIDKMMDSYKIWKCVLGENTFLFMPGELAIWHLKTKVTLCVLLMNIDRFWSSAGTRSLVSGSLSKLPSHFSCVFFSDYLFKLLLIGDSGVGKSCLLLRFAVGMVETRFLFFLICCILRDNCEPLGAGRHLHRELHLHHRSGLQDQDHRHGRKDSEAADCEFKINRRCDGGK